MYAHHYHHPFVLKKVHQYCKMYKLSVNMAKTIFLYFLEVKCGIKYLSFKYHYILICPHFRLNRKPRMMKM